jgi:hypothetical protein
MSVQMNTDSIPWKQSFPKRKYVRSVKLLKLVAGLDCQHCGSGSQVQAAHSNWGGGKGRGIKADDNLVAALCQACHYEIDQGAKFSREARQTAWLAAHIATVKTLVDNDQWPVDIPIPNPAQLIG